MITMITFVPAIHVLLCRFGIEVRDFGSSWRDGVAFNALIHGLQPELVDMSVLAKNSPRANLEHAFSIAEEHLGIPRLLDVEGMMMIIAIKGHMFNVIMSTAERMLLSHFLSWS